ncbi:hypothetical protein [Aliiroseovarius crassostreae]|uniref:hypothetical protein n=1 Tax=Aliiroseovarius crassostreae TaxID=154981 RepID=UPI001113753F|nr:hypothetical protein [Aliiroseovarius crassostreae]
MLLDEIRELYRRYSKLIDGQKSELPIGTTPDDFGGRHLEISPDGKMALVGTDRGRETKRQETRSVDELLYWFFVGQANSKAFYRKQERYDYEASQTIALDEIGKISSKWRERLRQEQLSFKRKA